MKPLLAIRLKALGTRFHGYDGKGTTLVIPACSKREYSLRPPYNTGVQRLIRLLSSDFFFLKILKALGTRFHGGDGKGTTLVIPACSKRESSDFFFLKILKTLGTRFHGDDGKGTTLVIPACSKREYSLRPPYNTGVQRLIRLLSSDFFFLKILKALGTRFHGYDGKGLKVLDTILRWCDSKILLLFFLPLSAHAFPVIDAANLHQNIIQVKHLLEEINTLKQQLDTAKSQLSSINGVRHMSGVIDSVYDISVKVDPNLTLKQQGLHNSEWLKLGGDMAGLYDQVNRYRGRWFGQTQISLQQTQARYNQLVQLIRKIDNAPQQKDIEDLQARINAEGVMLQNEQAKLQLLGCSSKSQRCANSATNYANGG